MKSLNSFADHAPKRDWLVSFFELKEDFFTEHTLGPMMYDMFRRVLRDAGLNEKNHFTEFVQLIDDIGYSSIWQWIILRLLGTSQTWISGISMSEVRLKICSLL